MLSGALLGRLANISDMTKILKLGIVTRAPTTHELWLYYGALSQHIGGGCANERTYVCTMFTHNH
jgi:hypothetical protein